VQRIQQLAGVKPSMGRRKVFVVGDAELMVPQESSPEAANAFLKLLEEPPDDTVLIITSSQPGALLPTIVSRVLGIRVAPLREAEVSEFLVEVLGVATDEADRVAKLARGSIGAALRLVADEDSGGVRSVARDLLIAALSNGAVPRYAAANAQRPFGSRGSFVEVLDALGEWLRDLMAVAAGAEREVADPAARDLLRRAVERRRIHPVSVASALERVSRAQTWAQYNVNPQLILADLLRGIQEDLLSSSTAGSPQ